MSFELDEATIAAMIQEARQCFLEEDAPEDLKTLQEGVKQGQNCTDFKSLLRAAHSLKGGAGIAQLSSLGELAHQLEDVLEALYQGETTHPNEAWMLMEWGVHEIAMMLNQAQTVETVSADPNLVQALTEFTTTKPLVGVSETILSSDNSNSLIQTLLENDLETCCTRIEQLSQETSSEQIQEAITTFYNECLLLGETLDLPWLIEIIDPLKAILKQVEPLEALQITQQLIIELRQQRKAYLTGEYSSGGSSISSVSVTTFDDEEWSNDGLEDDWNNELDFLGDLTDNQTPINNQDFCSQPIEEELTPLSQLRIPLERLEGMTNNIEELLVAKERLCLQQQQLSQVTRQLRQITRQFAPITQHIQTFYDQLAIAPLSATTSRNEDFDALELDGFTEVHSSLQTFQELILKIQENYADLNLINQDFADNVEVVHTNLDNLYTNITESRLVPFAMMAQRFIPQIQYLNRRFGKSVELSLQGEEILIDQIILEQLQTPLTHLINNAFDHGIEEPQERLIKQKSKMAKIRLEAKVDNNQLVIILSDDGQGIDLYKVYQKAKIKGIAEANTPFEELSKTNILNLIFRPNFSTAKTINELSGRGMGLDIVRSKIQKLRGTIVVETEENQGTTFIMKIPLNLSLMPLFLLQWQNNLLAIPTASVLDSIPINEIVWIDQNSSLVNWRGNPISVISLSEVLCYPQSSKESIAPQIAMVLDNFCTPFMVMVDSLLSEQKLIVKPFDDTVTTPNYLAGCTILGGGEIAPVILPHSLNITLPRNKTEQPTITYPVSNANQPTILVAEDSVATRRLLERLLTKVGFSVIVCRDGQDALDQLSQYNRNINLIISDVEMPRLNGFELLKTIRSDKNWQKIPVVMATSRTGQHHQQQAMQLGANAYLGKPILPNILLETIDPLLNPVS